MALALALPIVIPDAMAQTAETDGWYRLRTNSVPYEPQNVALDPSGGLWVSAVDGVEYAPGVWYRPPGASAGPSFQYLTNDPRNNLLSPLYNPPIVKPQLDAPVLYAVRDKDGNTWYALKNRKVLCEKADHSWLTIEMPDSSIYQPGVNTTGVDSAHRIRLIDKTDGTQEKLLIAMRGIIRIDAGFSVVETRQVYTQWNNDFINDALIDHQGRYWVASNRGVEKGTSLVNTTYATIEFPDNDAVPAAGGESPITSIEEDSQGNIWFGSDSYGDNGVHCYTGGVNWIKYDLGSLLSGISSKVHAIASGAAGSVWFGGSYSGLLRYDPAGGGQWTRYTKNDLGLESADILGLAFDGTGLWFTTGYDPSIPGNGTGVHYLTLSAQGQANVTHYTYRGNSTTLTSLRFSYIAADLSGGVWFPAYDSPSIARLKADGSWQQFSQAGTGSFGGFGFAGVAADSKNRVYFAPLNAPPVAYDVAAEQWINLPGNPFSEFYYYGVYADPQDGKWFHGAYFVYYLDSNNTGWTSIGTDTITPAFPANYYVDGVLADDAGNVWFMCRYEIVLLEKDPEGGAPTWFRFTNGDGTGYTGGYRVYQDDSGQVWNAAKQKFDPENNGWLPVAADTSVLDHRHLRFLNGRIPVDLDLSGALPPVTLLEERNMTLESRGTIYFTGSLGNVLAGIVAFGLPGGDMDLNGRVDLADAILVAKSLVGMPLQAFAGRDVNGDGKIGLAEMIHVLQRVSGLR
ncbi:MAG: transcriptional regulator [Deltaproteobacteria bacterium]|nr:transcriptional regulator [Deltaproteobacteria bacterium]